MAIFFIASTTPSYYLPSFFSLFFWNRRLTHISNIHINTQHITYMPECISVQPRSDVENSSRSTQDETICIPQRRVRPEGDGPLPNRRWLPPNVPQMTTKTKYVLFESFFGVLVCDLWPGRDSRVTLGRRVRHQKIPLETKIFSSLRYIYMRVYIQRWIWGTFQKNYLRKSSSKVRQIASIESWFLVIFFKIELYIFSIK